jgi:hypothetical protein
LARLCQVVRGGVAIGMDRDAAMRLAIRCAQDSIPPLRLVILRDLDSSPPVSLRVTPRRRENGVGLPADAEVILGA